MLSFASAAAEVMEHLCSHDGNGGHGYSQPNRAGIGTGASASETITLSDGTKVGIANGDRDCSSAVIECFMALGVNCGGATYTGNMERCMVKSGNFKVLPASTYKNPQRGDILLSEKHHTALALGNGKLGQFSISELGKVYGTRGDQTGYESNIKALYNYPWDCVLRCTKVREGSNTSTTSSGSKSIEDVAREVIAGKWGNGTARRTALINAGYDYAKVQAKVNELLGSGSTSGGSTPTVDTNVPAGRYKIMVNNLNIRTGAGTGYRALSGVKYSKGNYVNLDGTSAVADGWVWGRYLGGSGNRRWIAVRSTDGKTVYAERC